MNSGIERVDVEPTPGARQLSRGITATWWYTASAIVMFEVVMVMSWTFVALADARHDAAALVIAIGGIIWSASTIVLLVDYRHRLDAEPGIAWRRLALPMLVAVAYGVAGGLLLGSWELALMPALQSMMLLNWPRGVRIRIVVSATLVLMVLSIIDFSRGVFGDSVGWWVPGSYTALLPLMTVSSLWWWDVLVTLDRARASEARLAATQERLRVATDVHDLQGHHLQVIALQLELAERLMHRDPAASLEQLQLARASVDDARQGTRDLATRFRSVPLGDELANARDLLVAAGLTVESDIATDADAAPAWDLGPVIRETTTNVLRHGGGHRARLELQRDDEGWRYVIANDVHGEAETRAEGSGLDGIRRRITEAGGTIDVVRGQDEFAVAVTVPATDGTLR
ncbi:sensor histidine kinase [Microbacterium oxydans]|uniref:sensor histidine kinase n=1 Tax=Microbacterium oxydans TaxID=82380 RepID=UPI001E2E5E8A|nr:histidine kinase [Microbacterium oxydans]